MQTPKEELAELKVEFERLQKVLDADPTNVKASFLLDGVIQQARFVIQQQLSNPLLDDLYPENPENN